MIPLDPSAPVTLLDAPSVAAPLAPPAEPERTTPPTERFGRRPVVLALPAAAWLVVFLVAPLVTFAIYSVLTSALFDAVAPVTLGNYGDALGSDLNRTLARNSLVIGVTTSLVTVALGLPVAYWLRYAAGRRRNAVLVAIIASMFASYLVRIYAWRSVLGDNGLLNRGLDSIGVIDEPLGFLLFNRFSVVVALVHIFLPYVVLVLYAGFGPIQPSLLEAAQDLGARASQRWRRVVLPLIGAPAATAALFVFVLAASDYVTPQFLGGTDGAMIGVQAQVQFTGTGNWPLGAAISFLMLAAFALCYGLTLVALRLTGLSRVRLGT